MRSGVISLKYNPQISKAEDKNEYTCTVTRCTSSYAYKHQPGNYESGSYIS